MIDAKELKEALDAIEHMPRGRYADLILSAARAHLATLPRWKDVKVVRWAIVDPNGSLCSLFEEEGMARTACPDGRAVVKLTGTMSVEA